MTLLVGIRVVPDAKITRYLLDPDHVIGGPEARFFMAFGFARTRPGELVDALLLHASTHHVGEEVGRPAEPTESCQAVFNRPTVVIRR